MINDDIHMFSPEDCVRNSVWKKEISGSSIIRRLVCRDCGNEIACEWIENNGEEYIFIHSSFGKFKEEIKNIN